MPTPSVHRSLFETTESGRWAVPSSKLVLLSSVERTGKEQTLQRERERERERMVLVRNGVEKQPRVLSMGRKQSGENKCYTGMCVAWASKGDQITVEQA